MLALYFLLPSVSLAHLSPPGVTCNGRIPQSQDGSYVFHQNETSEIQFSTDVKLNLLLNQRSCFQVDIPSERNSTEEQISSVFYVIGFSEFAAEYPVKGGYTFGIPEVRSYCKCDCPKSDSFCNHRFDNKFCSKSEICVQKFYSNAGSYGCQHEGAANLCCQIAVRPFRYRKYRAIYFERPTSHALLDIDIYVYIRNQWQLFRRYNRKLQPSGSSNLKLNGYENVADLDIHVTRVSDEKFKLPVSKFHSIYLYYEENKKFDLLSSPIRSHQHSMQDYNFLLFENGRWNIHNPLVKVRDMHRPIVSNCRDQKYTDQYNSDSVPFLVIRNSSGSINAEPKSAPGIVATNRQFVESIDLMPGGQEVIVRYAPGGAPRLAVELNLQQKLSVIPHLHLSYLSGFEAKICLDKNLNRFLNITLINAHGSFRVEVYKGPGQSNLDVTVPIVTRLPLAKNHSEIIPLPGHVRAERHLCVHPERKPQQKHCKDTLFVAEPVEWFTLPRVFIETKGECPGCNVREDTSFFSYFDPRTWFNGIATIPEGIAVGIQAIFYFIIAILVIAVIRRVIWPLCRWALCPAGGQPRYEKAKTECMV